MMTITVIVPTYRRPNDLARCLEALKKQTRLADQVLVVVRDTDIETWTFLDSFDLVQLPLFPVKVTKPGVLEAHNAGYDAAQGDIIAITDDDAAPHSDWLERIEAHFRADNDIGGVGGRDLVYHNEQLVDGACKVVGRLHWFGRIDGNHHLGVGEPREVDVLKGVNSSYRRSAIADFRFDERRRISGTNTHYELAIGLALKRAGWKLIYDPSVVVDHYPGQRSFMAERDKFEAAALTDTIHNETLTLLEHLPPLQKIAFLLWALLIGTRNARGLLQFCRFLPSEGIRSWQKLLASLQGRWQGWQTWKQSLLERQKPSLEKTSNPVNPY